MRPQDLAARKLYHPVLGGADGLTSGLAHQTLLGVTGSGKTFSMANVIQNTQKPTLVLHSDNDFRVPIEQGEQ